MNRVRAAGERTRRGADAASLSAHRQIEGAANAFDRGYARASSDLARVATTATDYVTANPGKAVLFAAATGFAIGMLLRRSRAAV